MNQQPVSGAPQERKAGPRAKARLAVFSFYLAILAWAPFPLGSNRPWSWSLLVCLIAIAWILWWLLAAHKDFEYRKFIARFWLPLGLASLTAAWAFLQTADFVPANWMHPIWQMASETLGRPVPGAISLNPWRTMTEAMKLAAYIAAAVLAVAICQRPRRARLLLDGIILIGSAYALYAIVLAAFGWTQFQLLYRAAAVGKLISGPFVLHNSFATFCGLTTLCAVGRLVQTAGEATIVDRGPRLFLLTLLNFLSREGLVLLIAVILNFSMLVASASRAGFVSTVAALTVLGFFSIATSRQIIRRRLAAATAAGIGALLLALVGASGGTLMARLASFSPTDSGLARIQLWQAGERMIADAPLLGLGLGTFEDAYPLYASHVEPFIVDKAHNDYIEFAAGLGLPAAVCWWLALSLAAWRCLRGIYERRRDGLFPLLAVSATVLVGLHSIMDFSLQIPAVALLYATILGMGLAQSFSSRGRRKMWRGPGIAAENTRAGPGGRILGSLGIAATTPGWLGEYPGNDT